MCLLAPPPLPHLTLSLHHYSYTGDVAAMALCITMAVLIYFSHLRKNRTRLGIMYVTLLELFISAAAHIMFEAELLRPAPHFGSLCLLRAVHHILLTFALLMYTLYIYEPLWIPRRKQRRNFRASSACVLAAIIADILGSVFGYGFHIESDGTVSFGFNCYVMIYLILTSQIIALLIKYRSRVIRQVFFSLLAVNLISALLLTAQGFYYNVSYSVFAYFIPILGILYMFHSNPYDVETGAVSEVYFVEELAECIEKNRALFIIVCDIRGFAEAIKSSKEYRTKYYRFLRMNVRRGVLYHFTDGKLVLTLKESRKGALNDTVEKILADFNESYRKFQQEFRVVLLEVTPEINDPQDYLRLIEFAMQKMPNNEVYRVSDDDIKRYYDSRYILSQLEDIAAKNDLSDPRVLVYCQPVFNLSAGRFDTAEALMRLELEKTGIVYPEQFIPLAEQYNLIHPLSMIILDKTCAAIRDFIEEGYEIQRASVNFSVTDLRYSSFCQEVERIIDRNGIPYDRIAVEITESRSDNDFNLLKEKVQELQKLGIKFYLDDFGTGYSNFERIMEIPFDIIKFDRSMLIEFSKSDASRFMVNTFADMFNQLHYSVLFEGVENEGDEQNCVNMNAKFCQGYKYSRPIPIAQLRGFLQTAEQS